ncbi:MAG: AAA family ATPase, partial [Promicromonosporaceae bacterium]|nr:AAA family ATPase [Promicromonosporaceae bacterium]
MDTFVGRKPELERLSKLLKSVKVGSSEPGKAIAIRGRRRVGKSRMVAEFTERAGVPAVFFTATHGDTAEELQRFAAEVGRSNLPNRDLFSPGQTWEDALRSLALILPRDRQSIVVLDEVPYLMREDKRFEGMLQAVWDRVLNRLPVLLILIGSNRSEMERFTSYDRPFHLRGTEMELGPLSVSDVASFTGLGAADAIDAFAVTGGQPLILAQWESGMTLKDFIRESVTDPLSALLVSGERVLTAEFPTDANANGVLRAIGAGETTFTRIANS